MITDYESLVDKIDVISQDAYRMGRIEGVRYDPHDYNILGLIVASGEYRGTLEDNYHGISSLTRGSKKED